MLDSNPLLARVSGELWAVLSVLLWVILRVSGFVKKELKGKQLLIKIGRKEILHVNLKGKNLNLEVLPTEKNILSKEEEENKSNHTQPESEKILHEEELDTPKIISPMSFLPPGKLVSSRKKARHHLKKEKEVNTNGTSI